MKALKRFGGYCSTVVGAGVAVAAATGNALAQTDMGSTLTSLNGYWVTAEGLGIGILLFVIGRRVVRKI